MNSEGYGLRLIYREDLSKLHLHVSKVGVYCTLHNPREEAEKGRELFSDAANIVVSGDCWMDYVPPDSDKGKALKGLQDYLGISREETIAFGDQINDIGLLRAAGDSYAVKGAQPELKAVAGHVMTEGPEENGVLHVMESLLQLQKQDKDQEK